MQKKLILRVTMTRLFLNGPVPMLITSSLLKEEVDDIKTLDQSYRIPGGPIHELSQKIINKVQNRFEKRI